MLYVGVMSGTSCDGADVVVVDFTDNDSSAFNVVAAKTTVYPDSLKQTLLDLIANQSMPISAVSQTDAQLGVFFAEVINQLLAEHGINNRQMTAIGLHGQTVFHQPPSDQDHIIANTMQLGSAAITAQNTGIKTVANFRQMDVAYGGQGAPLAPILHQQLFSQKGKTVAVLNLGGIANITILENNNVIGFDTGPASCVMDEFIQQQCNQTFDESGHWAEQGEVDSDLLNDLLTEDYFIQVYPKSTGRELFNLTWLAQYLENHLAKPVDIQRTLLQLTVESIALGLEQTKTTIDQMVVCGGGVRNSYLMRQLQQRFAFSVISSAELDVDPDFIEAILMAWLAKQHISQKKLDLSAITGCKTPHVYGVQFNP